MDKGQANRLAFQLGKTILNSAQDFETTIADYPVDVSIRRTPSKPPSRALPGFESRPEDWPDAVEIIANWDGGSAQLLAQLAAVPGDKWDRSGEIGIQFVSQNHKNGAPTIWRNLASETERLSPDILGELRAKFLTNNPGKIADSDINDAARKERLRDLIRTSGLDLPATSTWVSVGTIQLDNQRIDTDGETLFINLVTLAICKAFFFHNRVLPHVHGTPLVDFLAISAGQSDLTMWEAAYWILRDEEPLKDDDIWDAIESRDWHRSAGRTPAATLHASLMRRSTGYQGNSKVKAAPHFTNLGQNRWILTDWGRDNPPCPRPVSESKSSEEAIRNALGLDRRPGMWPMPGGVKNYRSTVDLLLSWLDVETTQKSFIERINEQFSTQGGQATIEYIRMLSNLEMIDRRKVDDEWIIQRSTEGSDYLAAPSDRAMFLALDNNFLAIFACLVVVENRDNIKPDELQEILCRMVDRDWGSPNQPTFRMNWLRSLGLIERKRGQGYSLTPAGKAMLDERRTDAMLISEHMKNAATASKMKSFPTCWVFQANPNRWDARTALSELTETDFEVNQHKDKIKAGHKVFFWISGKGGGVFAIGTVLNDPIETDETDSIYEIEGWSGTKGKLRTQVRIDHCLDEPISRDEVKACEGLGSLQILKMSQGTNFKMTAEEVPVLAELYEEHGGALWDFQNEKTPIEKERFTLSRTEWSTELRDACATWGLPHVTNLVLEGVPGTGKTFAIKQITKRDTNQVLQGRGEGRHAITLHPATSYEDFVEGLRPGAQTTVKSLPWWNKVPEPYRHIEVSGFGDANWFFNTAIENTNPSSFTIHDGFFLRVCREAIHFPHKDFLVLLDEINRCNVPKVLGDLLTTLERSKRAQWDGEQWDLSQAQVVTLPYSKRAFFVPDNVFVVATMNTTDRSVAPLDAALRRRFGFCRVWPLGFDNPKMVERKESPEKVLASLRTATDLYTARSTAFKTNSAKNAQEAYAIVHANLVSSIGGTALNSTAQDCLSRSIASWVALNAALLVDLGPDAMLGHSYLFDLVSDLSAQKDDRRWRGEKESATKVTSRHWSRHILPQLAEVLVSNNRIELADASTGKADSCLQKVLKDLRQKSGGLWGDCFHSTVEGEGLNKMPVFDLRIDTLPDVHTTNLDAEPVEDDFEGTEE